MDCRRKFEWEPTKPHPDDCPLCGVYIGTSGKPEVAAPYITSVLTKRTDAVARDIMDGSERRAEMAAAMAGVPVSEMSELKITNLRDNAGIGENSVVEAPNEVRNFMQSAPASAGLGLATGSANIAAYRAGAASGPEAGAGRRMMNAVRDRHKIAAPGAVSSIPALAPFRG
jgi:hypothetical protein